MYNIRISDFLSNNNYDRPSVVRFNILQKFLK